MHVSKQKDMGFPVRQKSDYTMYIILSSTMLMF